MDTNLVRGTKLLTNPNEKKNQQKRCPQQVDQAFLTSCLTLLLLLLHSQLYLWSSPFRMRFYVTVVFFFNPAIEVVTFRLCRLCKLGVFLLPAFTHLGHECQDLLSAWDGMHVCTDKTSLYNLIRKSFGGIESEPSTGSSEKDGTRDTASRRTASPTRYRLSYSGPNRLFRLGLSDLLSFCLGLHLHRPVARGRRTDLRRQKG